MKQLVKHLVQVRFYKPVDGETWSVGEIQSCRTVNCANHADSRQLGREIADWLARGVGYRVVSETMDIERK